ncbi:MAG: hypothetical protein NTY48_03515 [Candidatus Diapherotrites archaeon]|nr:hypothetical protein [Candidatus Diapherotrites archaeon]
MSISIFKKRHRHFNLQEKAVYSQLEHVWGIGDFKIKLLHASQKSALDDTKKRHRPFFGSIISFGKKQYSIWNYSVVSDYAVVKAGKVTFKAHLHEVKGKFSFIRIPLLGFLVVDSLRLRAPFESEEKEIIKLSQK